MEERYHVIAKHLKFYRQPLAALKLRVESPDDLQSTRLRRLVWSGDVSDKSAAETLCLERYALDPTLGHFHRLILYGTGPNIVPYV